MARTKRGVARVEDYRRELPIAAPCERAFDAIATLEGVRGWWTPLVTGSAKPGGKIRLRFEGLDEHIDLRVARVAIARRPSEVVWSVIEHTSLPEWADTTIQFRLSPDGANACRLAFEHIGLSPTLACYEDCEAGWEHFLGSLVSFAESGRGAPFGAERRRSRR